MKLATDLANKRTTAPTLCKPPPLLPLQEKQRQPATNSATPIRSFTIPAASSPSWEAARPPGWQGAMVLPLVKLGSLAFRTLSKPIAARLKHNAGIHPKFRGFIIGIAQVKFRCSICLSTRPYILDPLCPLRPFDAWIAARRGSPGYSWILRFPSWVLLARLYSGNVSSTERSSFRASWLSLGMIWSRECARRNA